VFSVGDYRRQLFGAQRPSTFYDPENDEGTAARQVACDAALADLVEYMNKDGVRVAAFDATNVTRERRQHILNALKASGLGVKRMFIESVCDQEEVRRVLVVIEFAAIKNSTPTHISCVCRMHSDFGRKHSQSQGEHA
jgi:6-phosphofructo-2-kinase